MGVTCEARKAPSSGAPDFTLQWRVPLFTDFVDFLAFYWSMVWVLFAMIWTDS